VANPFSIRIFAIDAATAVIKKVSHALGGTKAPITKSTQALSKLNKLGQSTFKRMTNDLRDVAGSAGFAGTALGELFGITSIGGAAAALMALSTKTADFGFSLTRTSALLGDNAQDLAGWKAAGQQAGVSFDQVVQGMNAAQGHLRGALVIGNDPTALLALQRAQETYGLTIEHNRDGTLDYVKTFNNLIDVMGKIKSVQGQRAFADTFGLTAYLPIVQQGTYALDKLAAAQKGLIRSDAQNLAASKFWHSFEGLKQSIDGISFAIGDKLIPILQPLINQFAQWLDKHHVEVAKAISDAVQALVVWIKKIDWDEVKKTAKEWWDNLGGVKTALFAIAAISFAGPITSAALLVGTLLKITAMVLPSWLLTLIGGGVAAEALRQGSFDKAIPPGPNHDQQVAEAMAGGYGAPSASAVLGSNEGASQDAKTPGVVKKLMTPVRDPQTGQMVPGLSRWAAEGAAANLWTESGYNPEAKGDIDRVTHKPTAFGMSQYHADRVKNFEKVMGIPLEGASADKQLEYKVLELRKYGDPLTLKAGRLLDKLEDANLAGRVDSAFDMRPLRVGPEMVARGAQAAAIDRLLGNTAGTTREDGQSAEGRVTGPTDDAHDANVAAMQSDATRKDRVAEMQRMAVNITFDNAPPGMKVQTLAPGGALVSTKINQAMPVAYGALP
jgi:hypothetical protein